MKRTRSDLQRQYMEAEKPSETWDAGKIWLANNSNRRLAILLAMLTTASYRTLVAMSEAEVWKATAQELSSDGLFQGAGAQFDPEIIKVFLRFLESRG